jgi:hypothetical protein
MNCIVVAPNTESTTIDFQLYDLALNSLANYKANSSDAQMHISKLIVAFSAILENWDTIKLDIIGTYTESELLKLQDQLQELIETENFDISVIYCTMHSSLATIISSSDNAFSLPEVFESLRFSRR